MRIKICGVTTVEDALLATELGADALGLNFYPKSARFLQHDKATAILQALPPLIVKVGLFVEESVRNILHHLSTLPPISCVQWHGKMPLTTLTVERQWIPAFAIRDESSLQAMDEQIARWQQQGTPPAAVLVDAHVKGQYGGTGQKAPWKLLGDYEPIVPIVLAGGLTHENVAEAIRVVRPYAVDVASGVESTPGVKDAEKLRRFIGAVREVQAKT